MLGLDRGIAAGFYRRNERIGMPIVTVPGRRRQLRQEPTISVVCRAAHGFLRSTGRSRSRIPRLRFAHRQQDAFFAVANAETKP
jgi:hypothetical protein